MSGAQRIDKWLWHARFFKTRTLAAKVAGAGLRINGAKTDKPSATVKPGDTLTFPKDRHIRLIKVLALAERRGPAPEAQALYEDLDPPQPREPALEQREAGAGRPTKRDRRAIIALKSGED